MAKLELPSIQSIIKKNGGIGGVDRRPVSIPCSDSFVFIIETRGMGPRGLTQVCVSRCQPNSNGMIFEPELVLEYLENAGWHPISLRRSSKQLEMIGVHRDDVGLQINREVVQAIADEALALDLALSKFI